MKTLTRSDLKANFSEVLKAVQLGKGLAVAFGKRETIISIGITPPYKTLRRSIGILKGKASVVFRGDFKITAEEFLDLGSISPEIERYNRKD